MKKSPRRCPVDVVRYSPTSRVLDRVDRILSIYIDYEFRHIDRTFGACVENLRVGIAGVYWWSLR